MSRLKKILEDWKAAAGRWAMPLPKKSAPKPVKPGRHVYPAGMSEADKLAWAKERDRRLREAAEAAEKRDPGGPFTKGGKIGAPRKRFKRPT